MGYRELVPQQGPAPANSNHPAAAAGPLRARTPPRR